MQVVVLVTRGSLFTGAQGARSAQRNTVVGAMGAGFARLRGRAALCNSHMERSTPAAHGSGASFFCARRKDFLPCATGRARPQPRSACLTRAMPLPAGRICAPKCNAQDGPRARATGGGGATAAVCAARRRRRCPPLAPLGLAHGSGMARPASAAAAAAAARARALRTPHLAAEVLSPRDRAGAALRTACAANDMAACEGRCATALWHPLRRAPTHAREVDAKYGVPKPLIRICFVPIPRSVESAFRGMFRLLCAPPHFLLFRIAATKCAAVHQILYVHVEQLTAHGGVRTGTPVALTRA